MSIDKNNIGWELDQMYDRLLKEWLEENKKRDDEE